MGPSQGDRIGPYALVRRLGAGAQGDVWEAVLHGPGGFRKPVALKLVRAMPSPGAREAFLREARLGALLQHPNVVATLQVAEHGGLWCIALELVRGLSVDVLCRHCGGPLPPGVVLDVGVQAAAGLQHVHELKAEGAAGGLVHRDVKPANLLADRSGLVKLADLGVSLLCGEPTLAAGTPAFMAPEQAAGRPEPRSDLFSLGATLFALATGQRPFGRGHEALRAAADVEAQLADDGFLARVEAAVPGLAAIVRWCLRYDPARRPASARELQDALAALRARQAPGPTLLELLARASPELGLDASTGRAADAPTRILSAGNLRPARDAFVGRDAELAEVEALVGAERWLVVVGPGGMGKTRLALEVARRVQPALPGGAWAFDLTEARTAPEICGAVAAALGLELDRTDPVDQVGRVIAARGRALVVLDNLEQCVTALPDTVGRWTALAPEARFLGTSRVVPHLAGERVVALGELRPADATALFLARASRPLADAERLQVEPLCVELEAMPLAIELAAARLSLVDVSTLRARLGLALLAGGGAERPERHRSVSASLRWSCELLSPSGRRALGQLSVFDGGFDLAAAEAVLELGPEAPWALDVLAELADASLLLVDAARARFSMRVVVREFAATLLEPAARARAEERHGVHFAQLGTLEAIAALDGPDGVVRFRALARDLDNLVAACRRAVARGAGTVAVSALVAADAVLTRRGPSSLREALGREVAALPSLGPRERSVAERAIGVALRNSGHAGEAVRRLESALAWARTAGDRRSEGVVLTNLASVHLDLGRPDDARRLSEEAMAVHVETGNRRLEAMAHANLGNVYLYQGRAEEARACFERALAIDRGLGHRRNLGIALGNLAALERRHGRPDRARRHFEEALALHRETGNRRFEGVVLGNLALLHLDEGRHDDARAHLLEALAVAREVGNRRSEGIVLGNLGSLDLEQGRPSEARAHYERAVAVHLEVGNRRFEGHACVGLARIAAIESGPSDALALLDRALPLLRETRATLELAHALLHAAEIRHSSGDTDGAREALDEAAALATGDAVAAGLARLRASVDGVG